MRPLQDGERSPWCLIVLCVAGLLVPLACATGQQLPATQEELPLEAEASRESPTDARAGISDTTGARRRAAARVSAAGFAVPVERAPCMAFAKPGVLARAAIKRTVQTGLARWLGGVHVQAVVDGRKFRGWKVVSLPGDDACYDSIDVHPGDLVTRVNGKSVERPEQALEIFASLATAQVLSIDLVRQGRPRTVLWPIAEEGP